MDVRYPSSVLQKGKRYISFMCHSLGIMADVDLVIEPLQFMGEQHVAPRLHPAESPRTEDWV